MYSCVWSLLVAIQFFLLIVNETESSDPSLALLPEDGRLNFLEMVKKYGQIGEEFDITTEDGYILKLFHIKGNKNKHVLCTHGLFGSSDDFVVRGNESIALELAKAGYDVWVQNNRGDRYSRKHIFLDPDTDEKYWEFSLNEMGLYDLPATIDFVLKKTGLSKIKIIGHSRGNAHALIMASLRPEYNDKIELLIALAPIAFMEHSELLPIGKLWPLIDTTLKTLGVQELLGYESKSDQFLRSLCSQKINYVLCTDGILFPVSGYDQEEFEPDFVPVLFGHFPAGTSRMDYIHVAQLIADKQFSQFDFGPAENLVKYGSAEPPSYNITNIRAPVALLVGKNDFLSTIKDVEHLKELLPNVAYYHVMERPLFQHFDFVYSKDLKELVMPFIFDLLENYPKK